MRLPFNLCKRKRGIYNMLQWILLLIGLFSIAYLATRTLAPALTQTLEGAVSTSITDLLARFEGFRDSPYADEEGNWTIGIGHLIVAGDGFWSPSNPNGKKIITLTEARDLLRQDTIAAERAVDRNVQAPITINQRTALISLAYNIGESAFAHSTLIQRLNQLRYTEAAAEFARWNKVNKNGVLIASAGLTKRRANEAELFLT